MEDLTAGVGLSGRRVGCPPPPGVGEEKGGSAGPDVEDDNGPQPRLELPRRHRRHLHGRISHERGRRPTAIGRGRGGAGGGAKGGGEVPHDGPTTRPGDDG